MPSEEEIEKIAYEMYGSPEDDPKGNSADMSDAFNAGKRNGFIEALKWLKSRINKFAQVKEIL